MLASDRLRLPVAGDYACDWKFNYTGYPNTCSMQWRMILTDTLRTSESLLDRVRRIQDALQHAGIDPVDMRRAGTLETDVLLPQMGEEQSMDLPEVQLLGDSFEHHEIKRRNTSQFRWFIDGSQKTMPVWRIGVVPIVVSIAVAGVLERDEYGECHLVPGSITERLTWIVPEQTGDPDIRKFVQILHDLGQAVLDPLHEKPEYQALAGMYDQILFFANKASGEKRQEAELDALQIWRDHTERANPNHWLLIDGRLSAPLTNAVGLIKDPGRQHFGGEDAITLFNLPAGNRTTAYRLTEAGRTRTHWYQRMWPATGLDARHSLIRIEASGDMADNDEIDNIASWLMAERVPSAKADSRWPTLLYPIHLLERMLKRRIAHITAGWPI